ncbi:hypothetical protein OBBRIDRAFT_777960 [Obba rivulosa]|uniref:protein-tyrosine-phosphatase n=1 Tax=Obba rivulosa TaxID=1052685 RepID=A0A8E2B092_9APHY|nr:hypothetical protein OBBRIDRAFT_777960 [Obba rivulosa]
MPPPHPTSAPTQAPTSAPSVPSPRPPLPVSAFPAVTPAELPGVLSDPGALILDLRPHAAYAAARLPHAVSVSVPSTLLRRPLFPLARLAEMLPGPAARARLNSWASASRILVYDADTAALAEGSVVGLMRKFRAEGFPEDRQVAWLRGGFNTVARTHPGLLDRSPVHDEEGDADDGADAVEDTQSMGKSVSAPAGVSSFAPPAPRSAPLRTKRLPPNAFTHASTLRPSLSLHALPEGVSVPVASTSAVPPTPTAAPRADPFSAAVAVPATPASEFPPMGRSASVQPGRFALRLPMQHGTMSQAHAGASSMPTISPGHGHQYPALGPRPGHYSLPPRQVAYNPFFDTIRQNLELAGGPASQRGTGIQLRLPRRVRRRVGELPFEWLREIARRSGRVKDDNESTSSSDDSSSGEDANAEEKKPASAQQPKKEQARRHPLPHEHRSQPEPPSSPPSSPTHVHPPRSRTSSGARASTPSSASQSPASAEDLTRALEMQFYRIELGEQRRLMGVMERHSKESGGVVSVTGAGSAGAAGGLAGTVGLAQVEGAPGREEEREVAVDVGVVAGKGKRGKRRERKQEAFPFSITAGLEKGSKNRYRNIWPFEHARVRLRKARPEDDDYMNASYVQPLGTTKRYIATQGPLPATYIDFWTLCWEQNVHVIVMLTREIESATVKCGKYWADGEYGPLRLRLVETNDTPERERHRREAEMSGGFFSAHGQQSKPKHRRRKPKAKDAYGNEDSDASDSDHRTTIRRVFELTHSGYPAAPPRTVTQLQYLEWPDMNVPEDPRGVLRLMRKVEDAVELARKEGDRPWGEGLLRRAHAAKLQPASPPVPASASNVTEVDGENDAVDPVTGVAKHAKGNAPVLLHCSAGVGRTGGFIAVDAVLDGVRREMRKRRGVAAGSSASASASLSASGSAGRSSPNRPSNSRASSADQDAMDVDSSPSPPGENTDANVRVRARDATHSVSPGGLTIPVTVGGGNEVHVPVAGFAGPVPMDVDGGNASENSRERSHTQRPSVRSPLGLFEGNVPVPVLSASPALVEEVRRATLGHGPASAAAISPITEQDARPRMSSRESASSSDSVAALLSSTAGTASGWASASDSAAKPHSHSSVSPPTSSAGSSGGLSAAMQKTADLTLRSSSSPDPSSAAVSDADPRARAMSLQSSHSSSSSSKASRSVPEPPHTSRLVTWRSGVRTLDSPPEDAAPPPPNGPAVQPSKTSADQADEDDSSSSGSRTCEFALPRRLHDSSSPPLLSTYDEPIRRVIEDMREQRMSLCQSLRQYVFVHRAIIEGALMIVDEEKAMEREAMEQAMEERAHISKDAYAAFDERGVSDMDVSPLEEEVKPGVGAGLASSRAARAQELGHSLVSPHAGETIIKGSELDGIKGLPTLSLDSVVPPGKMKRGASPTELPKEDRRGDTLLSKRPSVKRKQRSDDDGSVQFKPTSLTSSSLPGPR